MPCHTPGALFRNCSWAARPPLLVFGHLSCFLSLSLCLLCLVPCGWFCRPGQAIGLSWSGGSRSPAPPRNARLYGRGHSLLPRTAVRLDRPRAAACSLTQPDLSPAPIVPGTWVEVPSRFLGVPCSPCKRALGVILAFHCLGLQGQGLGVSWEGAEPGQAEVQTLGPGPPPQSTWMGSELAIRPPDLLPSSPSPPITLRLWLHPYTSAPQTLGPHPCGGTVTYGSFWVLGVLPLLKHTSAPGS